MLRSTEVHNVMMAREGFYNSLTKLTIKSLANPHGQEGQEIRIIGDFFLHGKDPETWLRDAAEDLKKTDFSNREEVDSIIVSDARALIHFIDDNASRIPRIAALAAPVKEALAIEAQSKIISPEKQGMADELVDTLAQIIKDRRSGLSLSESQSTKDAYITLNDFTNRKDNTVTNRIAMLSINGDMSEEQTVAGIRNILSDAHTGRRGDRQDISNLYNELIGSKQPSDPALAKASAETASIVNAIMMEAQNNRGYGNAFEESRQGLANSPGANRIIRKNREIADQNQDGVINKNELNVFKEAMQASFKNMDPALVTRLNEDLAATRNKIAQAQGQKAMSTSELQEMGLMGTENTANKTIS